MPHTILGSVASPGKGGDCRQATPGGCCSRGPTVQSCWWAPAWPSSPRSMVRPGCWFTQSKHGEHGVARQGWLVATFAQFKRRARRGAAIRCVEYAQASMQCCSTRQSSSRRWVPASRRRCCRRWRCARRAYKPINISDTEIAARHLRQMQGEEISSNTNLLSLCATAPLTE